MQTKIIIKKHRYLEAAEITDEGVFALANAVVLQAVADFSEAYRAYIAYDCEMTRAAVFTESAFFLGEDIHFFTALDGRWLLEKVKSKVREEYYGETHPARSGRTKSLV